MAVISQEDIASIVTVLGIKDESIIEGLDVLVGKKARKPKSLKKDVAKMLGIPINLTSDEIAFVLSGLEDVPATLRSVASFNTSEMKEGIRQQLLLLKVVPGSKNLETLREYIADHFYRSLIPAGESVGFNSAMAIGQPLTQMGLNTFHSAGASNNLADTINSVKDLLGARRNQQNPEVISHFSDPYITYLEAWQEMEKVKGIQLSQLVVSDWMLHSLPPKDQWWVDAFIRMNAIDATSIRGKFLRLSLNVEKCQEEGITYSDIAEKIQDANSNPVTVIYSPLNLGIIDIHPDEGELDFKDSDGLDEQDKIDLFLTSFLPKELDKLTIRGIEGLKFYALKNTNTTSALIETRMDDVHLLDRLEGVDESVNLWKIRLHPETSHFEGIGAEKVEKLFEACEVPLHPQSDGSYISTSQMMDSKVVSPVTFVRSKIVEASFKVSKDLEGVIDRKGLEYDITDDIYRYGYNVSCRSFGEKILEDMLLLDLFDVKRIYPRNIMEMAEYFGIDAVRLFLSVSYSKYLKINTTNIHLIADFQTSLGVPVALSYSGSAKHNPTALAKAAFQDPYNALTTAAAVGVTDTVTGFSDCIMTGKKVRNGTGIVKIKFLEEDLGEKFEKRKEKVIEGEMKDKVYAEDDAEQRDIENETFRDHQQQEHDLPSFKLVKLKPPKIVLDWLS